jgi:hypothetical protein
MECPSDIVTIEQVEEAQFAAPQGPIIHEPAYDPTHWQALSAFTRVSHKDRPIGDPWGPAYKWRPIRRMANWLVWRTWQSHSDFQQAVRARPSPSAHEEDNHDS